MKKPKIEITEIKIAELRSRFKSVLELKTPCIVYRNSRPVGLLLSIETSWFGRLEHPVSQKRKIHADLEAVLAKVSREFVVL